MRQRHMQTFWYCSVSNLFQLAKILQFFLSLTKWILYHIHCRYKKKVENALKEYEEKMEEKRKKVQVHLNIPPVCFLLNHIIYE